MNLLRKLFRKNSAPVVAGCEFCHPHPYSQALRLAFDNMPTTFHATRYLNEVRYLSGTRAFDSTILRELRRMRQRKPNEYSWICIDLQEAIYQKIYTN